MADRSRICIISFSPIHRDARVLRQLEYLAPDFDLTVIGYGPDQPPWSGVQWEPVATRSNMRTKALGLLWLGLGRLWPQFYDRWYWQKPHHRAALARAEASGAAAFLANDWNALPVAACAAARHGARLVLDAHEYAPLEYENRRYWLLLYAPLVVYMLRRYGKSLDATMTVVAPIAARYRREFGFDPLVVMNTPKLNPLPPPRAVDPARIQLIHHGGANRDRHLELMIETLARTDPRFHLHFMLVDGPPDYVRWLHDRAQRLAPGRITFHDPVPPAEIVARIAQYDIGFFLLKPVNYSYRVALPNKFFDFLAAGLAVCVGPSPAMAALAREHGFGCVAPTFEPVDVATMLNMLTADQVQAMRQAARRAAGQFTADRELSKVVQLFHRLLDRSL